MGAIYTQLSLQERRRIEDWWLAKVPVQEKAAPSPKVKPVSAKNGYKKTGRRPPGRPSKMEAYYERRRKEQAAASAQEGNT